eukprot:CAMPEP_0174260342 /NCGR_PEP_ID=MMETSP0439-20130205/9654_1 /TAXON_ID=0 /ORGANISM="Stereomyxa ramosa, Strain Chinc5" /LENGTH=101 /DNA_ID=CAMNT_0015344565 /DNA_START=46 /DNA_END=351 /DNA_ORIENTATION=-
MSHSTSSAISIDVPQQGGVPFDLSTSVGGTIYATTPGGTKIVYDRNALLFLRNSPFSKTPPNNLAFIPGVTLAKTEPPKTEQAEMDRSPRDNEPEEMFAMD